MDCRIVTSGCGGGLRGDLAARVRCKHSVKRESCDEIRGPTAYVATEDLTVAVNAAVTLERPLLVKGEPGTGKTELARQVARRWGCR
jgi:MoxR-like ATPase